MTKNHAYSMISIISTGSIKRTGLAFFTVQSHFQTCIPKRTGFY